MQEKEETLLEQLERKIRYERGERDRLKALVLEKNAYIQGLLDVTYILKENPDSHKSQH